MAKCDGGCLGQNLRAQLLRIAECLCLLKATAVWMNSMILTGQYVTVQSWLKGASYKMLNWLSLQLIDLWAMAVSLFSCTLVIVTGESCSLTSQFGLSNLVLVYLRMLYNDCFLKHCVTPFMLYFFLFCLNCSTVQWAYCSQKYLILNIYSLDHLSIWPHAVEVYSTVSSLHTVSYSSQFSTGGKPVLSWQKESRATCMLLRFNPLLYGHEIPTSEQKTT